VSDRPILVGPFLGEVGLETLYWQPFVAHVQASLGIAPERVIPITRSGAHVWYGCQKALEIYDMRTVQDVRVENRLRQAQTGMLKQATVSRFDYQLYRDAADTLRLTDYLTLHPAWMYQTLHPFLVAQRGIGWVEQRLRFTALPMADWTLDLPERYVAVSFYARSSWEPTTITASVARETIGQIARQIPVVLLTTAQHMDDHVDYIPKPLPENVILLHERVPQTIQNSLAIKSTVVAKAAAYVGTYGGISHLALRYRVPSVNLFTEWKGIFLSHRQLSEALALQIGVPYHVLKLNEVPILQDVLPRLQFQPQTSSGMKALAPSEQMV
jgi:hypothetical protein